MTGSLSQTRGRPEPIECGARLSADRVYRYVLWRGWDVFNTRSFVVIGLNPSTADETQDDPTIRRCIGFAKREGCGRLIMLNLFALRATDPKVMKAHASPIGDENDATIRAWGRSTTAIVVAAWGVHGAHRNRAADVMRLVPDLYCFGVTKDGHPKHPLYLPGDAPIVRLSLSPADDGGRDA